MSAFLFHNIIPEICRKMENDRTAIRWAMISGTVLALVVNIAWVIVVLGVIPVESSHGISILSAFSNNEPATIPLAKELSSPLITTTGMAFSLCAIFTSYVAVAVGLRSFFADLITHSRFKSGRKQLILALTFLPPLLVAVFYPKIFLSALDFAGGLGGVLIFGVFPALIIIKRGKSNHKKLWGIILLVIFLLCMGCEVAQEAGWLVIPKDHEYWNAALRHIDY